MTVSVHAQTQAAAFPDLDHLRQAIQEEYAVVATDPHRGFN
jgi:hypothetical protein